MEDIFEVVADVLAGCVDSPKGFLFLLALIAIGFGVYFLFFYK